MLTIVAMIGLALLPFVRRTLTPHVDEMPACGVADMRPAVGATVSSPTLSPACWSAWASFGPHLGVAPEDQAVLQLRDAYPEVFSDLAPHVELVNELETRAGSARRREC